MNPRIAIIGAGPAGLALALHAAHTLPQAELSLFDTRPLDRDVAGDRRTLALALGSVQWLQQLGTWPAHAAAAITGVHVSQVPPSFGAAAVQISAAEQGVVQLGAVLPFGALVATMQAAWLAAAEAAPQRLHSRFGTPVTALKAVPGGVELDAGINENFDLAVVAEGGVFADQARKAVTHDYAQTAWVGTVTLAGATPGLAFERFTRQGPAALLPLPPAADGTARAALVWCVDSGDDPVRGLDDTQRLALLNTVFPREAGRLLSLSPLKAFALGLNAERTLVDGRTVRIGNAAQTLHPVAGQGLNLGLRDAHQLVEALRFNADIDAALKRVEWARAPDRWAMIAATDFLARSFTWRLPGAATLRGAGLAALQRFAPGKAVLARRMMFGGR
ncbi:MAG: FAD-dependent monooxygenase [Rubrivivax sp.]|nr:FAD-dependent monooxygenase [Rubrivivax sp.]